MRSIKPIALKEVKLLSNEEMKNLFGGKCCKLKYEQRVSPRRESLHLDGQVFGTIGLSAFFWDV